MHKTSSLYIHFPYCMHLCNYCDFFKKKLDIVQANIQIERMQDHLIQSWNALSLLHSKQGVSFTPFLDSIYIGGGTPSLWRKEGARWFYKFLMERNLLINHQTEFTLEVDPGTCSMEDLIAWQAIGVNRISFGMQAYSNDALEVLDRRHRLKEIRELALWINDLNIDLSLDFLIGIPNYKSRDIIEELTQAITDFSPSHFSVYILKGRAGYKHFGQLPCDDESYHEYLKVSDFLQLQGYQHYEISNFSKPGKQAQHNLKYWQSLSVAALGMNASGFIDLGNDKALRYQWKSQSSEYQLELLNKQERLLERVYLALRTSSGLDLNSVFNEDQQSLISKIAIKWKKLGVLSLDSSKTNLILNPKGFVILDSLMDDLFTHGIL